MSRQTSSQYYRSHQQLRRIRMHDEGVFAELSSAEQWLLHDYFKPDVDWLKEQLLAHRADIAKRRPGLPQQAGRAYAKLQAAAVAHAVHVAHAGQRSVVPTRSNHRGEHILQVKTVVQPELDARKYARALLKMAQAELTNHRMEDDAA